MTNCCDEGQLRAYLDGELPALQRAAIGTHIASCEICKQRLASQQSAAARIRPLLAAPVARPDPQAALARLKAAQDQRSDVPTLERSDDERSKTMLSTAFWSSRRRTLGALAAIVAVLSLLALPPVRAAADDLLSIFRVQKVVFVPVDAQRVRQLQGLDLNGQTLFVGKPVTKGGEAPRTVGSAAEASAAVGYAIAEPTLPAAPTSTEYRVTNPGSGQFQINVDTARQVLQGLGVTDVEIPDALGAGPISVEMPAFASAHYRGAGYDLTLNQGPSPKVTLPDGVDLAQLGRAALRVLGMTPDQAEAASKSIDWSSTLLFPFPADTNNIRQVNVGGADALLISAGERGGQHWQLYWQRGDRFYMLQGTGLREQEDMINLLISTAESIS